jgi:CMP-N,N'-diacetyllegionaminic acid synthase
MFFNKRVLVVSPARGGSKGVALKNLRQLNGIPLIASVGSVVKALPYVDRAIVSTDHKGIAEVAVASGLACPFLRPEELSGDRVADWDVLHHALLAMENIDSVRYDIIVMLQPTSPFREPEHVSSAIKHLITGNYDSVWTVSLTESKQHPVKQLLFDGNTMKYYHEDGGKVIARQQLPPVYHRNGIAYAISRECLVDQKSIIGINASAIVIDGQIVNIDNEEDIIWAEFLLSQERRRQ